MLSSQQQQLYPIGGKNKKLKRALFWERAIHQNRSYFLLTSEQVKLKLAKNFPPALAQVSETTAAGI